MRRHYPLHAGRDLGISDDATLADVARVREVMDKDWTAAWRPRARLSVSQWAQERRVIAGDTGATSGRWRNDRAPYLVAIMDSLSDPSALRVTLKKCAQSGGTESWINWVGWTIDEDPVPTFIVFPNKKLAEDVNKERLLSELRATPEVAEKISPRPWDVKSLSVKCDRMRIRLAGANSDANLASWPQCRLIMDEFDKYPDPEGVADKAESRTITFKRRRILAISTPTLEDWGICKRFKEGDRRVWWVPCPACGAYQVLRFSMDSAESRGGVRWAGGLDANPAVVRQTAWYECEFCANPIGESRKGWMNRRGLWLPGGLVPGERLRTDDEETIRRAGLPHGHEHRWAPRVEGTAPASDHHSYHIHGCMTPWQTWGQIAAEFVEDGGDPKPTWVNEKLGEGWKQPGVRSEEGDLLRYATEHIPGEVRYTRGTVPPGALVLSMHMDVQLDCVFYEVVAWGERAARWLIDWGVIYCPNSKTDAREMFLRLPPEARSERDVVEKLQADPWLLVERQCRAQYPRLDTGEVETVRRAGIDCRYRKHEVFQFIRRMGPNVMATQGGGGKPMIAPYQLKVDEEHGLEALTINTFEWKNTTFAAMHRRPPTIGAWRWPTDLTRYYAMQMTSEELVEEDTADGKRRIWQKIERRGQNHWWDCAVSGYALAHYNGVEQLTAHAAQQIREAEAARKRAGGGGPGAGAR